MSKKKDTAPEPMDARVKEHAVGVAPTNHHRVCWAIKTLVAEFRALFPETPVEYSNIDGRNTALDVTFDLTEVDADEREAAAQLLQLVDTDKRVEDVIVGDKDMKDQVLVSMFSSPRTQDSRAPFGLGDSWVVLTEPDGTSDEFAAFVAEFDAGLNTGGSL